MADRFFSDAELAALYDAFCPRSQRADFDFYLPAIMAAGSVLDVGCGTGALLHEVRDAGHAGRLCGLDPAPGMIAQARRRADIEWILGDLSTVAFDREFDLIVMTGHAFQALVTDAEIAAALAAVRAALTDEGVFAFETRNPLARAWDQWTPDHPSRAQGPDGCLVQMVRQVERAFDGDTVAFSHTFTSQAWPDPQLSRSTLRFLSPEALETALTQAGLAIAEHYGDWDRSPPTPTSPEIILLARRR